MKINRKQKWEEKQLCGRFKRLTSDISYEKTWTWLRKGKLWNMKVMIIPIVIVALVPLTKGLVQRLEDLEITGRVVCPNYSMSEIGQNTEKSPGNLKRLAVTQTPVKNLQLTLM